MARISYARDGFAMLKNISLSILFFASIGLLFAAYASVPI